MLPAPEWGPARKGADRAVKKGADGLTVLRRSQPGSWANLSEAALQGPDNKDHPAPWHLCYVGCSARTDSACPAANSQRLAEADSDTCSRHDQ